MTVGMDAEGGDVVEKRGDLVDEIPDGCFVGVSQAIGKGAGAEDVVEVGEGGLLRVQVDAGMRGTGSPDRVHAGDEATELFPVVRGGLIQRASAFLGEDGEPGIAPLVD